MVKQAWSSVLKPYKEGAKALLGHAKGPPKAEDPKPGGFKSPELFSFFPWPLGV